MTKKIQTEPKAVFNEYRQGNTFKAGIGEKGIFEQSKINERFFVGDQWHGAQCGDTRPLVRRNVIKRIGEYKMSAVTSAPIAVNYSADGIPNNASVKQELESEKYGKNKNKTLRNALYDGEVDFTGETDNIEVSLITSVMSDYFNVTAERIKLDAKKEQSIRNAYISGTTVAYTYWDDKIETGLYVDEAKRVPIKGDLQTEILDIENVVFGDANNDDVQSQPFIIISQRRDVEDVRREAKRNGISTIDEIRPDGIGYYDNAGERGETEPAESRRITVLTKFYKEWDKEGSSYKVMAVRMTERSYVRKPWDLGVKLYPIAKMCWERRRSCAYGESEITYLIPNQIAINRAYTADIWSIMTTGMPMMIVNGDVVPGEVTNTPGQVLKVYGNYEDVKSAITMVSPPAFSAQMENTVNGIAQNTLSDSGANDAALGNVKPDNASAIIQMREATLQPMQIYNNRFYDYIEDIARIWADFWINKYGDRLIRIEEGGQINYIPFHAQRYRNLSFTVRIDVGSSPVWSTAATISTLDSLYGNGIINRLQYLKRIPQGIIPDLTGLIKEAEQEIQAQQNAQGLSDEAILQDWSQQNPQMYQQYLKMTPEQQQQILLSARGAISGTAPAQGGMENIDQGVEQ